MALQTEQTTDPAQADPTSQAGDATGPKQAQPKKKRVWRKLFLALAILLTIGLIAGRLALPSFLRWYVDRTLDQSPMYDGQIGEIEVHLLRGAYTITDIRIIKTSGNVPVPFFSAKRMDVGLQWKDLIHGKVVGRLVVDGPQINFVDAPDQSSDQTGAGGPWLAMLKDLLPFKIDSAEIHDGAIHFLAYQTSPPVDVYLAGVQASVTNLTNISDDITPLYSTVTAKGTAMESGELEMQVKLDPFSYYPTFQIALKLVALDVTKLNKLAEAYGGVDFEGGWFDFVVEMDSKEGRLDGYVKPLFRHLKVFTLPKDIKEDNPIQAFWEAVAGVTTGVLTNRSRDQFGTVIPFTGNVESPEADIFAVIGNVLRNAFIRAYLPRLVGRTSEIDGLQFSPGKVDDPVSPMER